MTKERDKAMERCNKLIETEHSNWIGITNQKAIETVLNMLKENSAEIHQKNTELAEKNAEIEKYKKLLADNLAKNLNDSIKAKEKADTDLDDLDKGWKVELEKKDKMIDLRNKELIIKEDELKFSDEERIKLNKMIDLMAEQLIGLPVNKIKQDFEKPNFKAEITIFTDKEDIKQHFERKATNDG